MKTMIRMLVAAFMVIGSAADAQTKVSRGLPLNATGAVRIFNLVGSVKVTGWNRDSIAVRGALGKGNSFHMGGGLGGVKMFVEGTDDRNPAPANLEVMVPTRAKVWVKTANAIIEVSGVAGSLDLYVVSGGITVRGDPADVTAEAIDGTISILGSPSWARAKNASGDVRFQGSTADLTLSTVSGDITVAGKQFEKAKFETVTGRIGFAGGLAPGGLMSFDSHSGAIEIGIAGKSSADFDVVSLAGSIVNRLTSTKPSAGRYGRGSELNTSSGTGGTRVVVKSFKGDVVLRVAAEEN